MTPYRRAVRLLCVMAVVVVAGCATKAGDAHRGDPLEGYNRAMFGFNEGVDAAVLKPVATGYRALLPSFVRTAVDNVFGNLGDLWSAANQFLQGKPRAGVEMTMRVLVNSTLGFGGVLDIASEAQLPRQSEDFGQTLGRWGMGPGPYLVLPLLGPSTLRDAVARSLDLTASPGNLLFNESRDATGASLLQLVHARAGLLDASRALDEAALDKYILVRDGYLVRRHNLVYDGDPPEEGSGTR